MNVPEQDSQSTLLADREATRQKIDRFVSLGKPIIEGSNLTNEASELTDADVEVTRNLLQAIAPKSAENAGLYAHLELTTRFARKIGEELKAKDPAKYQDLNLSELEILGLLHDVGRFFTHRWLRNELVEMVFLTKLGIKPMLIANIPNELRYLNKDPNNTEALNSTFAEMPLMHRIIEMADFYGKRKPDGGINTFDETMEYHFLSRENYQKRSGLAPIWASERKLNQNLIDFNGKIYPKLRDYFGSLGVNIDKIREGILAEEKQTLS